MDMEWAKDGLTNQLFIVQARPETVQAGRDFSKIKEYTVKGAGKVLVQGISVGSNATTGSTHVILSPKQIREFKKGEILVTTPGIPDTIYFARQNVEISGVLSRPPPPLAEPGTIWDQLNAWFPRLAWAAAAVMVLCAAADWGLTAAGLPGVSEGTAQVTSQFLFNAEDL